MKPRQPGRHSGDAVPARCQVRQSDLEDESGTAALNPTLSSVMADERFFIMSLFLVTK
jgi:hypothetical protein